MGALGMGLALTAMFAQSMVGLIAVVSISASLSLMFPTIYGVALQGLGEDTKFGAAGLVMAILGGALLPLVQGAVMDAGHGNRLHRARGLPGPRDVLRAVRPPHPPWRRRARGGGRPLMSRRHRQLGPRSLCVVAFGAAALLGLGFAACGGDKDEVTARPHHEARDEPVLRQDQGHREEDRRRRQREAADRRGEERRRQREPGSGAREDDRGGREGHPHHPGRLDGRGTGDREGTPEPA